MKNKKPINEDLERFNQIMGYKPSKGIVNEAWSDYSTSQKVKLGLGAAATMTGVIVMWANHIDTKVTEPDGTVRQGIAGEKFTGRVTYMTPAGGVGLDDYEDYYHVGIKCDDGTFVEVSIETSEVLDRDIKVNDPITISVTEDTWLFRDDPEILNQ
jgi:hypothetical protein